MAENASQITLGGTLVRTLKVTILGGRRVKMGDVCLQKTAYVINKDTKVISVSYLSTS